MKPRTRRVIQAVLYEAIAVAVVGPALSLIFNEPVASTIGLAILMSTVALVWNYLFNGWFERWEVRQTVKGLVVTLVPVMAWWLNTSLLGALVADLGILAFFFFYAVAFTWAFDRIFGLPQSASSHGEA